MGGAGLARIEWSSPQGYLQNLPLQVIYFLETPYPVLRGWYLIFCRNQVAETR